MILINLLPHREAARMRRKRAFLARLGTSVSLGFLLCGAVFVWYQHSIDQQQERNLFLQQEIARLDLQIKDIASLQKSIAALRARQNAVENLQGDRNLPVHLLDELVVQMPDGVHLNSMKQENQIILLTGVARSQERVSELLRKLGSSAWLSRPELVEIVAVSMPGSNADQRRVSNFTIRVALARPSATNAEATGKDRVVLVPPGKV